MSHIFLHFLEAVERQPIADDNMSSVKSRAHATIYLISVCGEPR